MHLSKEHFEEEENIFNIDVRGCGCMLSYNEEVYFIWNGYVEVVLVAILP